MTSVIELDLTRLSLAYQSGMVTPRAVIAMLRHQIQLRGDDGIWLSLLGDAEIRVYLDRLEAMTKAERDKCSLWGIPFAIKDNIDLAGCPTTAACPAFSYMPEKSAVSVQRLIDAGAIPLGKTNLDQFATGLVGTRTPGKAPVNPFDPAYVSGGSSSGSAAAVAVGLVSFALGTDTAGSGRVPAGLCNLVGLKPTVGRVSTIGLVPASRSIDCISVFAFTVSDAMTVLGIIENDNPSTIDFRPRNNAPFAAIGERFRFGIPSEAHRVHYADSQAEIGFHTGIAHLTRLGGEAVELDFTPFAEAASLLYGPLVAERLADLEDFFIEQPDAVHPITRHIIEAGAKVTGAEVYQAQHRLAEISASVSKLWASVDCLVVPTYPRPVSLDDIEADPIEPNSMLGTYTNFVNLLDLSAIAVPAGFRHDGLPHGVTLIGPSFAEDRLAPLAARLHARTSLPLGATGLPQPHAPWAGPKDMSIPIAVFGAHLSGERLNHQLLTLNGTLSGPCRTAPQYRLYALPDGRPGLIRVATGGVEIIGEIWRLPPAGFGQFAAAIPGPLGIGQVVLNDGSNISGFLCEAYATADTPDISHFGGWRAWRRSLD